ncbi:SGNH/GDSL hydrolase family protein [Bacillus andreraoultii]|uniref:SGNH/GDSL hydrolase family protein n=1 Tax=Bacillus andreraoultii TaxID=1499685 RepID=UPI00053A07A7|nr:SGNH/GDSL hydrolase family protein [Bacillus andreraoultii]
MLQRILVVLSFIAFIAITIVGGIYWNNQQNEVIQGKVKVEAQETERGEQSGTVADANRTELQAKVKNLPKSAQTAFLRAYDENKQVRIAFVGSLSLGKGIGGWSDLVSEELAEAYDDLVTISTYQIDGSSNEFIVKGMADEVAEEKFDIVMFEPFTLKDNGTIGIDNSLKNLTTAIEALKEANSNITIIIQPPNPIFGAVNYPRQVEEDLKGYAEENDLPFFDHWDKWPDYQTQELLKYLDKEGMPNGDGHALWAEAIMNYFVAED